MLMSCKEIDCCQTNDTGLGPEQPAQAGCRDITCCNPFQYVWTATITYTANCPPGTEGEPVTATATATSTVSQEDANALALAEATELAEAALECTASECCLYSASGFINGDYTENDLPDEIIVTYDLLENVTFTKQAGGYYVDPTNTFYVVAYDEPGAGESWCFTATPTPTGPQDPLGPCLIDGAIVTDAFPDTLELSWAGSPPIILTRDGLCEWNFSDTCEGESGYDNVSVFWDSETCVFFAQGTYWAEGCVQTSFVQNPKDTASNTPIGDYNSGDVVVSAP